MSQTLCTFPGRYGDLLWALPTVRAISEAQGQPVDLLIAGEFRSILPLLQQQPYLHEVYAQDEWSLSQGWQPPMAEQLASGWAQVYHLGYRRWPELPLPHETYVNSGYSGQGVLPPNLLRPWITVEGAASPCDIAVGFTEAWFELKYGLLASVDRQLAFTATLLQLAVPGGRWTQECVGLVAVEACHWLTAAQIIRNSDLFFGDCAALHVLAVGLGKRCVICEPMEGRWNPIFWPLGMTGPQVTCVIGTDGKPTFDARACAQVLQEALRG